MQRDDCHDIFKRIPERYHPQVNVIFRGQGMLTVDTVIQFEPTYLVLRGREGGSTDEARAFFVPYEEIAYIRIERVVKVSELKKMCGTEGYVDTEDTLGQQVEADAAKKAAEKANEESGDVRSAPMDPAAIAKQNLLDRIRAARASAVSGKLGK